MPKQVKMMALLTTKPGRGDELLGLLHGMANGSRAEPGNLRWDIWQDRSNRDRFVLDELYEDETAAQQHRETAHYKAYLARIGDLADRTAVVLDPVQVEG
jgi:quinol monooxygenase YgiN